MAGGGAIVTRWASARASRGGIERRRVDRTGAGDPGGAGGCRLAPEQADPAQGAVGQALTGVAMGAVQDEPGAQLRLGIGGLVGASGVRVRRPARRGSIARLLMRMSWEATATNELTLPSRSASSVASASR